MPSDRHALSSPQRGNASLKRHKGEDQPPAQRVAAGQQPAMPLVVEICAGSAMLSRCFQEAGFDVLAVDHSHNRFSPMAKICNVDLSKQHGWTFLEYVLLHYPVVFVHAAPPCGTCSRAREIPLPGRHPQPLRSEAEPPSWNLGGSKTCLQVIANESTVPILFTVTLHAF